MAQELLAYMEPIDLVTALLDGDLTAQAVLDAGIDIHMPKMKSARDAKPVSAKPAREPREPREPAKGFVKASRMAREDAAEGDDGFEGARPARKLSEYHEPGFTRIHLNQGKAQRLAPGRLVQLVCAVSGLKGESIGAIAVHFNFCFFDVKDPDAGRVAELLTGMSYNGKKLKANLVPQPVEA
jgi:hypothetical protein